MSSPGPMLLIGIWEGGSARVLFPTYLSHLAADTLEKLAIQMQRVDGELAARRREERELERKHYGNK